MSNSLSPDFDAEPVPPEPGQAEAEARAADALRQATQPRPSAPKPPPPPPKSGKKQRWTLKVTPEEEATGSDPRKAILGWLASLALHVVLVSLWALLLIWTWRQSEESPRTQIEVGTAFGDSEGLDDLGGFDEPVEPPGGEVSLNEPTALNGLAAPKIELSKSDSLGSDLARDQTKNAGKGGGADFGIARFGIGKETIRGVEVKVGDPQFTLIWDAPVDLDLHVIEPGGQLNARNDGDPHHIFFAFRKTDAGGELDVDNTQGFGPENVYWLQPTDDDRDKRVGSGPPGDYRWYIHYYGREGGKGPVPVSWKMRVKHGGQVSMYEGKLFTFGQRSKIYTLRVGADETPAPAAANADEPEPKSGGK